MGLCLGLAVALQEHSWQAIILGVSYEIMGLHVGEGEI